MFQAYLLFSPLQETTFPVHALFLDSCVLPSHYQRLLKNSPQDSLYESPLAAPLIHAVMTPQQPSTITHLPVHLSALHHLSHLLLEDRTRKSLRANTPYTHLLTSASVGISVFPTWVSTISPTLS
ncbi:hypothetical protein GOODEAATRI_026979 [Goodea atripinnis]|uniref:Uncharacterized protein n=1 Tax=Goodea atripinnis TaxID=208336 RepID=A0ABV0ML12_9TELE